MDEQNKPIEPAAPAGGKKSQRALRATNLAAYTLVAVAIIVVVNWFSNQHVKRWDLTKNQTYSLSPQTVKLLRGLNQDLTLYVFDQKSHFQSQGDVLNLFSDASHRV